LDIVISAVSLIILSPVIVLFCLVLKLFSPGPIFFRQRRIGINGSTFKLIKFRTMKLGSERMRRKYKRLNEADGPVFKIYNDPRYTKIGRILAKTGFDEAPQLVNVLKGEMSLVGPRPLPVYEAKLLSKKQKIREFIRPGITSSWIVSGAHQLTFKEWMQLDKKYVINATFGQDISILLKTGLIVIRACLRQFMLEDKV